MLQNQSKHNEPSCVAIINIKLLGTLTCKRKQLTSSVNRHSTQSPPQFAGASRRNERRPSGQQKEGWRAKAEEMRRFPE